MKETEKSPNDQAIVLIVDDSRTNVQILSACLQDSYLLKTAACGEECLQLAKELPLPDLILLDIEMPGLSGYQVFQQLKTSEETASIPVIFVTGKQADNDEEYGFKLGAVDYISKPFRPSVVAARVNTHITLKRQRDKLEMMALHDQLTGLYNRYYLMQVANHKITRSLRHNYPLCVLMMDVDHFKSINDNFGHLKGDAILKAIAARLVESSRQEDVVARFGGEEFLILLDQCKQSDAISKAEEFRKEIETLQPEGVHVTISAGVAELNPDDAALSHLIKRADDAVYRAKSEGRNRVISD